MTDVELELYTRGNHYIHGLASPETNPERIEALKMYRETPLGAFAISRRIGVDRTLVKRWCRTLNLPGKPIPAKHPSPEEEYSYDWIAQMRREQRALVDIDLAWNQHPDAIRSHSCRARAWECPLKRRQWVTRRNERIKQRKQTDPAFKEKINAINRGYATKARAADPERYRKYARDYWANASPEAKLRSSFRGRLGDLIRQGKTRRDCWGKTSELTSCTLGFLMKWIETRFLPGMTWDNYGKWDVDHWIPVKNFDLTKKRELKKCFHYTNLHPLWERDNIKKGAKTIKQMTLL